MAAQQKRTPRGEIRDFILKHVEEHPHDLTSWVAAHFQISRQATHQQVAKLVKEGLIVARGSGRNRRYEPAPLVDKLFVLPLSEDLQEDWVWRELIRPNLKDTAENVLRICEYGFTEMLNNAIDHSEGQEVTVGILITPSRIELTVSDDGVGIFRKIQRELGLAEPRLAILELAKGKLTTDPTRHTGEGIFFTSRAFDSFSILSHKLTFLHDNEDLDEDWLMDHDLDDEPDTDRVEGTCVAMKIDPQSSRGLKDVFNQYASPDRDYGFTRTVIPVSLARIGDENLVSRSQAKRLLERIDRFQEVVLDFDKVDSIGQAFADEIFRVYRLQHPNVNIVAINDNENVAKMIMRALTNNPQALSASEH